MSTARLIATSDVAPLVSNISYKVGNFYIPKGISGVATGVAPGAGSIRLFPGFLKQKATLNALGVRVSTLSAAGNVQAAVYAADASTGMPTGNALASTASMSTGSVASVNAAISLQIEADTNVWWATNCDNGTAVFAGFSSGSAFIAAEIGSATQSSDLGSSTALCGYSFAQTFGTWPDLTGQAMVEILGAASIPLVQFKVASVP